MKFWCFYIPVLLENTATATLKLIIGVSTAVSSRKAALLVSSWLKPVFKVGGKCFASLFLLRFTVCRNRLQEAFNEGQTSCFLPTYLREILGAEAYWPLLLSSSCVPAFAQLLFLPWFPESPRYLLIDRGDELSCAKGNSVVLSLHLQKVVMSTLGSRFHFSLYQHNITQPLVFHPDDFR